MQCVQSEVLRVLRNCSHDEDAPPEEAPSSHMAETNATDSSESVRTCRAERARTACGAPPRARGSRKPIASGSLMVRLRKHALNQIIFDIFY